MATGFETLLPRWLLRAGIASNDPPRDVAGKEAMNVCVLLGVLFVALPYGLAGLWWGLPNYIWFAGIIAIWHVGLLAAVVWTSTQPDPNKVHRVLSRIIPYGIVVIYIPVTTWLLGPGRTAGFPQIWAFLVVPFAFLVYDDLREAWLLVAFMIAAVVFQESVIVPGHLGVRLGPPGFVNAMRIFDWFAFTGIFGYTLALHRREMDKASRAVQAEFAERTAMVESLRVANARAESAVAAKGEFLASMSHEIRTPMNAIVGMSHLTLATQLTETQRNYVERTRAAASHLVGLINNLLDHSRFEASGLALDIIDFRLDDVLGNLVNVTEVLARRQGIELIVHVAPDVPPQLRGDPLRVGQILLNLAANAVKFTPTGEVVVTISVAARTPTNITLALCVRDTGIGMGEEVRQQLFQAFSQGDASIPRRFGGSGLGLSIAQRLVEAMGGTLTAESEEERGSTFRGTVTLAIPKGFVYRPDLPAPYARALIIDDNPSAAAALAATLRAEGVTATEVHSGPDAIAAASGQLFDWIFVDEELGGQTGWEVVRQLRTIPQVADTSIALLTRTASRLPADALAGAGIVQVLEKPCLRSAVASALSGGDSSSTAPRLG
jgi:signal transduction histidine kinase/ActR/RegA family two-component response regulator